METGLRGLLGHRVVLPVATQLFIETGHVRIQSHSTVGQGVLATTQRHRAAMPGLIVQVITKGVDRMIKILTLKNQINKINAHKIACFVIHQKPQTVLMMDCPQKWPDKSFKEIDIFSMETIEGSALELSAKWLFS